MRTCLFLIAVLTGFVVGAETPDVTDSMVPFSRPTAVRWKGNTLARTMTSIHPYKGKLYTSAGEWNDNLGPCPMFAIDPYTGVYENEYDAGTETVWYFREDSEGRLYVPGVDEKEGAAHEGSFFRKGLDGLWKNLNTIPYGSITNLSGQGFAIHTWDLTCWKGKVFTAGYGLAMGPEGSDAKMSNATPQLRDCWRTYGSGWSSFKAYRRFCCFLPFENDLYCMPLNYATKRNLTAYPFEEWKYDETKGQFVCSSNTWANVAPGVTQTDYAFHSDYSAFDVQLWDPVRIGDRINYILGEHAMSIEPWCMFSAVSENGHLKATRVDLGSGVHPFCITRRGDKMLILAASFDSTAKRIVNTALESDDGLDFTPVFRFTSANPATAIAYYDGNYYVGMGDRARARVAWPTLEGTDVSGQIYRIRLPQEALQVVSETETLTLDEGSSGALRFRLSAAPADAVTLSVSVSGNPHLTLSADTLVFTPSNWSDWQTVTVSAADDRDYTVPRVASVRCCGEGLTSGFTSVQVNNNDIVPPGLVDLTCPEGAFYGTTDKVNVMVPFNDATDLGDTANRVLVKASALWITYEFAKAKTIDAYAIYNFNRDTYSCDERAPRAWTFAGANDLNGPWTVLDERMDEGNWAYGEKRFYVTETSGRYRFYRLNITANNGGEYTQFSHLEYYRMGEPDPDEEEDDDPQDEPPAVDPNAAGRLLVNEGFSLDDYATPSGTYGTSLSSIASKSQESVGFASTTKWNTMGSSQLLLFIDKEGTALPLPEAMTNVGFRAVGTSVGCNPGENNAAVRGAYRTFAAGTLAPTKTETGTYCFRVLLNVDSAAFARTTASESIVRSTGTSAPSVNYYGAGFTTAPSGNCYGILTSQPATLAFFIAKNAAGEARLVFRTVGVNGLTEKETDLGPATLGSTHICYAEVKVNASGNDVIRAGYQLVKDYTTDLVWQGAQTNDVISAGVYPGAIAIGGCYGTNKGNFRADEFAVGTSLRSVLAVPAMVDLEPPVIGGGTTDGTSLSFGQDAQRRPTFGVTVTNAKAGLTYQAYAAEHLTDEFRPYGEPIQATADGALPIVIPTDGKTSLFVKIVLSQR